jgi:Family of unknown function (DUF5995)
VTPISLTDQKLLAIVAGPVPVTIDDVIQQMEKIDNLLPADDGLKWFNRLYLYVTTDVKLHHSQDLWENPSWLTRLDVIFAGFYFAAVESAIRQTGAAPKSWQVLFESRHQPGIDRIQFAFAGMNAHINHDLALALLQVDAEFHSTPGHASPEHDDYERVNGLLEEVMPTALLFLATGILGLVAESTGKIGQLLAIWNVRAARDLAWDFSGHLHSLPVIARNVALTMQDKITGALGRSLLRVL